MSMDAILTVTVGQLIVGQLLNGAIVGTLYGIIALGVAVLAIALAQKGARVGVMDADVYGPNLPQMLGIDIEPAEKPEHVPWVDPIHKHP